MKPANSIRLKDIGTHCHIPTGYVFFVGECENCGGLAREVNGIRITNLKDVVNNGLLISLGALPPEICIIDGDTGECGCEACG